MHPRAARPVGTTARRSDMTGSMEQARSMMLGKINLSYSPISWQLRFVVAGPKLDDPRVGAAASVRVFVPADDLLVFD